MMPHHKKLKASWPRHWYNYPIILCGIMLQYVWALSLSADADTIRTTVISSLMPYFSLIYPELTRWLIVVTLMTTATLSLLGFGWRRNIHTILSFIPQQFVMFLCAGGAIQAMASGRFADGTIRTSAFLVADQSPTLLLAIFHTWAMILILLHGEDELV